MKDSQRRAIFAKNKTKKQQAEKDLPVTMVKTTREYKLKPSFAGTSLGEITHRKETFRVNPKVKNFKV